VIGNSAYRFAADLANPTNDATDISAALRNIGFEVVEGKNLDNGGMKDAIREFSHKLGRRPSLRAARPAQRQLAFRPLTWLRDE
jgi:Caspase domain